MADFANGGVFPGPKIRHFRGFTVYCQKNEENCSFATFIFDPLSKTQCGISKVFQISHEIYLVGIDYKNRKLA